MYVSRLTRFWTASFAMAVRCLASLTNFAAAVSAGVRWDIRSSPCLCVYVLSGFSIVYSCLMVGSTMSFQVVWGRPCDFVPRHLAGAEVVRSKSVSLAGRPIGRRKACAYNLACMLARSILSGCSCARRRTSALVIASVCKMFLAACVALIPRIFLMHWTWNASRRAISALAMT